MYAQLLRTALGRRHRSGRSVSTRRLVSDLMRCRRQLAWGEDGRSGVGWAPGAVAHQVAYDAALVRLCERLGISVDLTAFGQPEVERRRLETALSDRGISLDGTDGEPGAATGTP